MPIVMQGALNTTALTVPDLYVQIVPPQPALNGVPSNVIGVVGTASWGPLNTPTPFGSYAEYQANFGPLQNATFDMGTQVAIATQQGANSFYGVRVDDGTGVKATCVIGTTDITFTARYTGTTGNSLKTVISAGGKASTYNVAISLPGVLAENYTNIGGTGNTFWVNVAAAVNNGQGPLRGPSQLVTAVAGAGTDTPTVGTSSFTSGTNGTTTITTAVLLGSNGIPRTGAYALQNNNVSVLLLADATDDTQWSAINALAETIAAYAVVPIPASTSIADAVTAVQTTGTPSAWLKVMHGDWLYWYDQVNGLTRLVSPAAFAAGEIAATDPSESSLNKQLSAVIGSQTAGVVGTPQQATYSSADLSTLFSAGIDVICNPAPGGSYWAVRGGINSSLSAAVNGDNYTRLTNYISTTLNSGMGQFVGRKINTTMDREAVSTIASFLGNMQQQSLLGTPNDPPQFIVTGGLGPNTPNPQSRTQLGYYQINVAVTYTPINRFFIVNLQGGQTVVTSQPIVPTLAA
jgi:Bacteriophage tail sheath protein